MVCNHLNNYRYIYDPWIHHSRNDVDHAFLEDNNKSEFNILDTDKYLDKITDKLNIFSNHNKDSEKFPRNKNFFIILILIIVAFVWIMSGLYTIKEAERGVVLRFGKYHHLVQPGLNWKPTFFDIVIPVNVESVRELAASGMMLTSDENVVRVEMNVQYRVTNPKNYLFNVIDADDSLRQATDSALRGVIGKYNMDRILTEGRTVVRSDTRRVLEQTIRPYNMGITLLDVNFQTARPPEEVKAAFDDAIAARENEQQYIREAEAYANEVQPRANGHAQRILEEGRAYKARTILEAQGEVQRFSKILPEYRAAPEITRERLYINSMERVLSNTRKIFVNSKNTQNVLLLPSGQVDKIKNNNKIAYSDSIDNTDDALNLNQICATSDTDMNDSQLISKSTQLSHHTSSIPKEKVLDQRQANIQRIDIARKGRES
ncbi:FtsH protease activity modulator HflK [Blochmannia endosymbiont of Camponotus sp. C-003]|uniref:FtsH protease activity modulator HflK n=1 Tax=unclassified Candidatus Blochmanniella TaxID=711328 RepID=UPI0020248B60|nr:MULTISPECIES: FtsH protease activity modulator HflK [unclassified Candidatus Blochmannia]URJ23153.1 FtsH protease activity modulator HflK [Blochmannia endosymbiont of Camponotus sp. C-003]URJ28622.1 FtsH protease activity modulator HflK [Blochmannia endosymbiont of Camponotus sp. C-046]